MRDLFAVVNFFVEVGCLAPTAFRLHSTSNASICETAVNLTSCARGVATQYVPAPLLPVGAQAPRAPPSRRNAVLSHAEYVPTLTAAAAADLLILKVHGVRVTCDVGYLCGNFGLPMPLCSRLRPDVRDRQTDVRQTLGRRQTKATLNAPAY